MSIHIIGNGSVSAVCDGASILQAFGPTYSSPNAFRLDAGSGWHTERIQPGVFRSTRDGVTVTDWAGDFQVHTLMRRITGRTAMKLTTDQPLFPVPDGIAEDSFMSECHPGQVVYPYEFENGIPHGYVSAKKRYFGLRLMGELSLTGQGTEWTLTGEGCVLFVFSDTPAMLFEILQDLDYVPELYFPPEESFDFDADAWAGNLSPARAPFGRLLLGVWDTILAQQSASGGVLAGYNYHLCYLRDNYGVYRGLRAMGADSEADALAGYYVKTFADYGRIHNAQGPEEFAFHVHENDAAEITAYLVLMLSDYLLRGEDRPDRDGALAAIRWALEIQHAALDDGMLPFNGDETYIAGGLLSRACMNDGSMEATALYHKCLCQAETLAERFTGFVLPEYADTDRAWIESTFRDHFFVDGRWVCNCPGLPAPAFRHGVRACGHGFGLSFRNENGDYVCRECLDKHLPPIWSGAGQRFAIPAAILCPAFVDSPLISVPERVEAALAVLENAERAGQGTGYDLGFVLWALTEKEALSDPAVREKAIRVRDKLLTMTDEFGAYSEYYVDGFSKQHGTLCRPWESAINIAAILRAAEVL